MHKIDLLVGDWSGDGHGQTVRRTIVSNLSRSDIERAYVLGSGRVGFDLRNDVCVNDEDTSMSIERYETLRTFGLPDGVCGRLCDEFVEVDDDDFFEMFLHIVKIGDPSFTHMRDNTKNETIVIGGYGLFYEP